MIEIRPFAELGAFRNEWLNARHHFSFGGYHDPARMGVGGLRVWNDDEVAPGTGFDPHPHREMEIITYVRQGALTHKDSVGNEGTTEAGDVQVMHAGTGIVHAEYNKGTEPVRLFQIWIMPNRARAEPGWATRHFPRNEAPGEAGLTTMASGWEPDIAAGALRLNANGALRAGTLRDGERVSLFVAPGHEVYLVPATGALTVNGVEAKTRDGVLVAGETKLDIVARGLTEIVLVEVGN
jgi:redox-sensitive bicupin YhaK (pirin superfamily)